MNMRPATSLSFQVLFDRTGASVAVSPERLREVRLTPGEVLFDQGEFDDRLYILDDGLLEVSVLSASGRRLALNQLSPGSVFGEIAILDPGPRTARIEALKPSRLRALRHRALMDAISRSPDLAAEMLSLAGQRLRWLSSQMEEQVFLAPAARLASKVLFLMDDAGQVRMSQEKLADFVGVTREVVSKTLAEWRREGLVDIARGRIDVLDVEALELMREADIG